ncbi:MAG: DNA-processing protein DprA [Rhodospirillaceae bacterium]|nr:DNA-processing protein DprA [Rhodospirillaceae bacterium]
MQIKDFSDLKGLMDSRFLDEAVEIASSGQYEDAAAKLDKLHLSSDQKSQYANLLAYTYYRRALLHQCERSILKAINDLEKAHAFPGVNSTLRLLIQNRLTAIQSGSRSEQIVQFDDAISRYFEVLHENVNLRDEFLRKYRLSRPQRIQEISHVDDISTVGVYRWKADANHGEQWSRLIREFKQGDEIIIALFGRVLAEHVRATSQCMAWLKEVDYIVPVPADARRSADRGTNIVVEMASHLSQRLAIPCRTDILKRDDDGDRSRFTGRSGLERQYSLVSDEKKRYTQDRVVLLLDDVTTRGHTASVCAQRLKEAGCRTVYLLALAQAESSLQSSRHFGEAASAEVDRLAPWLCLAEAEGLGPLRLKALLERFSTPGNVLVAQERDLRDVPDIGPRVMESIRKQSAKAHEYTTSASELINTAATMDARILTLEDPKYPTNLKDSNAAPAIVYALGSAVDMLQERNAVAIVGTRQPVAAAADIARGIATALARAGWVVVSGMAEGVDSLAHTACLEARQATIAFLGNGVDVTYPPSAKALRQDILRRGALISEYPFGMRPSENRLRRRNTLTVGHSRAVIVVQSATDGGTMNAVRAAERLGKPIFCVEPLPGSEDQFRGNAELLNSGRALPVSPHDAVSAVLASAN